MEQPINLVDAAPRYLGPTITVGPLAYGLWRFTHDDPGRAQGLIETALDAGMNLIDTADIYGFDWGGTGFGSVEAKLGQVLAQARGLRDKMVLATKGGIIPPVPYDSSHQYLVKAVDASLARLGVDVIDLYQIHRPDMFTHPAQVAETLTALRDAGKIREVGVSNYTPDQYEALAAHLPFPMVSTQPEFSVLQLNPLRDGTLDRAMRDNVTPLAWSPLGGGRLFRTDDVNGPRPELIEVLDAIAAREGTDRAAVALAFVLAHPARPIAIVGTQNPDRIVAQRAALSVALSRADIYAIVQASEGVPLP